MPTAPCEGSLRCCTVAKRKLVLSFNVVRKYLTHARSYISNENKRDAVLKVSPKKRIQTEMEFLNSVLRTHVLSLCANLVGSGFSFILFVASQFSKC